jgi:hypothetical protein
MTATLTGAAKSLGLMKYKDFRGIESGVTELKIHIYFFLIYLICLICFCHFGEDFTAPFSFDLPNLRFHVRN